MKEVLEKILEIALAKIPFGGQNLEKELEISNKQLDYGQRNNPIITSVLEHSRDEEIFRQKTKIKVKPHLHGQFYEIYKNSPNNISWKIIKSGCLVLGEKNGKIRNRLTPLNRVLGHGLFFFGYLITWVGIMFGFFSMLFKGEAFSVIPFKYAFYSFLISFPLLFLSIPFYNATLIEKHLKKHKEDSL